MNAKQNSLIQLYRNKEKTSLKNLLKELEFETFLAFLLVSEERERVKRKRLIYDPRITRCYHNYKNTVLIFSENISCFTWEDSSSSSNIK